MIRAYARAGESPAHAAIEQISAMDDPMWLRRGIGLSILLLPTLVSLLAGDKLNLIRPDERACEHRRASG